MDENEVMQTERNTTMQIKQQCVREGDSVRLEQCCCINTAYTAQKAAKNAHCVS